MNKLKEKILKDNQLSTSPSTDRSTASTSSSMNNSTSSTSSTTAGPSNTYIYGVGIFAVLAIGVYIFFAYNTSQAATKKQVNEKQHQSPKQRNML